MKKIINRPENFVDETMDGIIAAYGDRVKLLNGDRRILLSGYPTREGKVGIGRPGPSTPWGKPALGLKTRAKKKASNKMIVRRRDGSIVK